MTYKNWDDVRDHRVYASLNQTEKERFFEAMRIRDLHQQGTAMRVFALEQAEQIIIRQPNTNPSPVPLPDAMRQLLSGAGTVANSVLATVISTVKQ